MGYRRFDAQFRRNYKAGTKIADDLTKLLFWGGLATADYVYKKSKSSSGQYKPLTTYEEQELELLLSTPFKFSNAIVWHSIAFLLSVAFPLLGVYLYCEEDWWMFFSVLICGMLELCLLVPTSISMGDKIKSEWVFNTSKKEKQIKQVKILLWLSIITNIILIVINSYPFVVYYEGGILVSVMTLCLYFANGCCIYMNIQDLKNINIRFEQNVNKFSKLQNIVEVYKDVEPQQKKSIENITIIYNDIEHIRQYQDKCHNENISLDVIKANIRISNAMIDGYKKGYSELTYKIIEQQLVEKIKLAKRDFVKRECTFAIRILNLLKTKSVNEVIEILKYE